MFSSFFVVWKWKWPMHNLEYTSLTKFTKSVHVNLCTLYDKTIDSCKLLYSLHLLLNMVNIITSVVFCRNVWFVAFCCVLKQISFKIALFQSNFHTKNCSLFLFFQLKKISFRQYSKWPCTLKVSLFRRLWIFEHFFFCSDFLFFLVFCIACNKWHIHSVIHDRLHLTFHYTS